MFLNFCCSNSTQILKRSMWIRFFHISTSLNRQRLSYYEILGVKTDCSQQEIRNAFVIKSKQKHPDMKNQTSNGLPGAESNKEFIELMEAYQVLSKTHSRANYDNSLKGIHNVNFVTRDTFHEPWKAGSMSYTEDRPYYGVKGIKKIANWKIVLACVIFCGLGIMLQAVTISKSVTFKRDLMQVRSAMYSEQLKKARDDAEKYGNVEQTERLKMRLKESAYETKPEV